MEHLKNKKCKVVMEEGDKLTFYNGIILDVQPEFIVMRDRYDVMVTLNRHKITRIEETEEVDSNE